MQNSVPNKYNSTKTKLIVAAPAAVSAVIMFIGLFTGGVFASPWSAWIGYALLFINPFWGFLSLIFILLSSGKNKLMYLGFTVLYIILFFALIPSIIID